MTRASVFTQAIGILAALVEERVGLHYRHDEREILGDKLTMRAQDAGFESLLDYYYFLRYDDPDGAEMKRLVEALLVHETYLFRELRSLEVAIDHAVVPVIRRGRRARIWSAACASGEEPVSLAVLLAERQLLDRCEIVASDVSEAALERARRGRYRGRSLRSEGLELASRWLRREGDEIVVPQHVLDAVELRRVNLCAPAEVAAQGEFDLVVCRYVLIYFSEPTVIAVVASLADQLRAGGTMLVGISESLLRFSSRLVGEEVSGSFLYRRAS
jgi:chemotaxis protein methyltransferase CheR